MSEPSFPIFQWVCSFQQLHLDCFLAAETLLRDGLRLHTRWCKPDIHSKFLTSTSSAGVLIYGWAIFQKRLTMISARDSGSFGKLGDSVSSGRLKNGLRLHCMLDLLWGPIFICFALFIAILANFIFRLHEAQQHTGLNPLSLKYAWNEAGMKNAWMKE